VFLKQEGGFIRPAGGTPSPAEPEQEKDSKSIESFMIAVFEPL
jgi:hypothetical protein